MQPLNKKLSDWLKEVSTIRKSLQINGKLILSQAELAKLKDLKVDNFINPSLVTKERLVIFLMKLELAGYWLLSDLKKGLTSVAKKGK